MRTIDEAIAHAKEVAKTNRELAESDDLVRNSYSVGLKVKQCLLCAKEHEQLAEWLEELKRYKGLEEQGLLLKLPCEIGKKVYKIYKLCDDAAWEIEVHKIRLEDLELIGKTVFLTQAEAENALKKKIK